MPRIKLVTNVADYGFFRPLARTRAGLMLWAGAATIATFGVGLGSAHYILGVSSSVMLNLLLITANMMLLLVTAYLQAMVVGDLFFSGPWREQVILGRSTGEISVHDHNAEFMIVLILLVIGNALLLEVVTDGFLSTYQNEGFFRSMLRSDPADRTEALSEIGDRANFELWTMPGIQDLVVAHLDDPDAGVRKQAIWDAGALDLSQARVPLEKILGDPHAPTDVRAEAATALGKLGNDDPTRRTLEKALKTATDSTLLIGVLRGLALMKSPLSVEAALPLTSSKDENVMLYAFWVLRNSGEPSLRPMLHKALEANPSPKKRCALLDTLKMVATDEDMNWARREFERAPPKAKCDPVIWTDRDEKRHYVLYGDSFRVKYLKIVANASGKKYRSWFERIVADPEQPWRVREVASEVIRLLDKAKHH